MPVVKGKQKRPESPAGTLQARRKPPASTGLLVVVPDAGVAANASCREAELHYENLHLQHLLRQAQAIIEMQRKLTSRS